MAFFFKKKRHMSILFGGQKEKILHTFRKIIGFVV